MTESVLLRFSFFEHEWDEDIDSPEKADAELLRRATEGTWFEVEDVDPDEFDTIEALAERVEEVIGGEWDAPATVARLPLDRLRTLIAEGGWTFVAGEFSDFEGHHNDTELLVKLTRAPGSRA
ncbi:hypothetical protein ACFQY4_27730 [Catellatospora bangladeshensis]|uniref:Uncharacterized protein n=1 Tax=Catellatospora bangladeshensis TaxID=310355 RepID=A0A8J3NKK5_9ACTN|nr:MULTISPECIES: hypothetical protein [Catellatospora]BCJ74851.1 hypothetical protein CS0771_43950 [Catellatospora sp. IY07-71]GIF82766.1 hypothetical protein Cba03nite_41150 [Catellatospora bangladeshensis]